jgi:copper chaperone
VYAIQSDLGTAKSPFTPFWQPKPTSRALRLDLGAIAATISIKQEGLTMTTLLVPDMSCNHCKATVETALGAVPDIGPVTVDLANRRVLVEGAATPAELIAALDSVGYPATIAT